MNLPFERRKVRKNFWQGLLGLLQNILHNLESLCQYFEK